MKSLISLSIVAVLTVASFVSAGQIGQSMTPAQPAATILPEVPAEVQLQDEWTVMDRYDLLIDEPLLNQVDQQYA